MQSKADHVAQVAFGALSATEREEVLRLLTRNMPLAANVDLGLLAEGMRCDDDPAPGSQLLRHGWPSHVNKTRRAGKPQASSAGCICNCDHNALSLALDIRSMAHASSHAKVQCVNSSVHLVLQRFRRGGLRGSGDGGGAGVRQGGGRRCRGRCSRLRPGRLRGAPVDLAQAMPGWFHAVDPR